jgi:beta-phosphoglucomutase-like phosphatase (HAD superfamily)
MLTSDERLKALIFDVDGTLYEQGPVRRTMLYRILRAHLTSPAKDLLTLWTLRAYREAQKVLRGLPPGSGEIAGAQLASSRTGVSAQRIASLVGHWMGQEPLPLLASSMRKGTLELLGEAKRRGLRLAA